jgi:hypothetical protein
MQTFLIEPSLDFSVTAKVLDNKRLNKQSLEAWQIMLTNLNLDPVGNFRQSKGWVNHPAVKMWKGHEVVLFDYISAMTYEWVSRGYQTTIYDKAKATLSTARQKQLIAHDNYPDWMLNGLYEQVAKTHRIALLSKNYDWYSQFNWLEDSGVSPESYEYIWV